MGEQVAWTVFPIEKVTPQRLLHVSVFFRGYIRLTRMESMAGGRRRGGGDGGGGRGVILLGNESRL